MPDILTLERVAECRERAERATDGPWMAADSNEGCWPAPPQWEVQSDTWANPHHYPDGELLPEMCLQIEWYGGNTEADAEFIAHARTDIPALCATVEAMREENERLRNVLTFVACGYACVHYPDQDRDHSGIQYPDCVDPDIECCVADALRARELSR